MAIHLIVQYCNDSRPARASEYDECVRRNLDNVHVAAVHALVEPHTVIPEEFRSHPKFRSQTLDRWMTYRDAFDYAGEKLAGEIVCIANLDIFLDPSSPWDHVGPLVDAGIVLCQSRTEFVPNALPFKDPELMKFAFANSQDAWIFRAPLAVPDCDFEIGELACDNAIAHRILQAGRTPVNVPDRFRILHYDQARGKNFKNQSDVHGAERAARPPRHPEQRGQYLLPNMDQLKSVDEILNAMNLTELERYRFICDVFSHFVKIDNT